MRATALAITATLSLAAGCEAPEWGIGGDDDGSPTSSGLIEIDTPAAASGDLELFAVGLSSLVSIDPATSRTTFIGQLSRATQLLDLSLTARPSDGALFAWSNSAATIGGGLFRVDGCSGAATPVAPGAPAQNLAFVLIAFEGDRLFGITGREQQAGASDEPVERWELDPTSGAATLAGSIAPIQALAFGEDGLRYEVVAAARGVELHISGGGTSSTEVVAIGESIASIEGLEPLDGDTVFAIGLRRSTTTVAGETTFRLETVAFKIELESGNLTDVTLLTEPYFGLARGRACPR